MSNYRYGTRLVSHLYSLFAAFGYRAVLRARSQGDYRSGLPAALKGWMRPLHQQWRAWGNTHTQMECVETQLAETNVSPATHLR
jgi:hypothetical protein